MLSVNRLINVGFSLSPIGAVTRNFGILNIAGDSTIIHGLERSRNYTGLAGMAFDGFSTTSPEYLAAQLYFAQSPQPVNLTVSRWLRVNSPGILLGLVLNTAAQALSNFTAITAGTLSLTIDGTVKNLTGLNFSGAASLNAVAAIIQTALSGPLCVWMANGSYFKIVSSTTGTSSSVTVATGTAASVLGFTAAQNPTIVPGYAAETPLQCATALDALSPNWYGLMFAASVQPATSDYQAVSTFIQGTSVSRMFGVSSVDTNCYNASSTTDVAYLLQQLGNDNTVCQYSQNPYAIASLFGRAFTVDFTGNNTTITLMYKQEPSVVAENLTESQAEALEAKRCNVFVQYNNSTAIIQDGTMCGPAYFDEIHGLNRLQNALQTEVYDLLYGVNKVPQTDAGNDQIVNAMSGVLDEAVSDGLVAPGVWNAPGFGSLQEGQTLKKGYYIYAPPIALQSESDRAARKSVSFQIAIKLAGAIQTVNVMMNVNR